MADSPIQKAIVILKWLASHGKPLGVQRIASDIDLNISTVHRLLQVLAREGMVSCDPNTRLYSLGTSCITFASQVLGTSSLSDRVRPVIARLAAELQETSAFCIYEPERLTKVIAVVERGPQPLGYEFEIGVRDGIHAGASGKAILAFLPEKELTHAINAGNLTKLTESTIVDPVELRRQARTIVKQGYATSLGERVPGAGFGIGAPVFRGQNEVFGSIVVTIPLFRWQNSRLAEVSTVVKTYAKEISEILSYEVSSRPEAEALGEAKRKAPVHRSSTAAAPKAKVPKTARPKAAAPKAAGSKAKRKRA